MEDYIMPFDEEFTCILATRYAALRPNRNSTPQFETLTRDAALQDEKDRMDIYHKIFEVARRGVLHQAPVYAGNPQDPPRILDLGCGTGIWAIDMAE